MDNINWEDIIVEWDNYCDETGTVNNVANYHKWLSEKYLLFF